LIVPVVALLGALFMLLPQHGPGRRILMKDYAFVPIDVALDPGDALSFRNAGLHTHTATCVQCPVALDTGDVQPGEVAALTFRKPGTYILFSRYDAERRMGMRVRVGRTEATPAPQPTAS
jgi:plastocyanin